jgi:hypothetical protein
LRNYKTILSFAAGAGAMILLFFGLKSCLNLGGKTEKSDYYILTNQISKMNKMVVMEQNTSSMQKTKMGYEVLGKKFQATALLLIQKPMLRFLMILIK